MCAACGIGARLIPQAHLGTAAPRAREPQAACSTLSGGNTAAHGRSSQRGSRHQASKGKQCSLLGIVTQTTPQQTAPATPLGSFSSFSGVVRPCRCRPFWVYCSEANLRTWQGSTGQVGWGAKRVEGPALWAAAAACSESTALGTLVSPIAQPCPLTSSSKPRSGSGWRNTRCTSEPRPAKMPEQEVCRRSVRDMYAYAQQTWSATTQERCSPSQITN